MRPSGSGAADAERPRRRGPAGPPAEREEGGRLGPGDIVFLVVAAALILGGGRKWLQSLRARRAIARLREPEVSAEEIEASAAYGREALWELFRLLGTAPDPSRRDAAGRALARLWVEDQLIAEEEKGIITRGYAVTWRARRRYPRALRGPIPLVVTYGVPFLNEAGPGVAPSQLEWSHRLLGAHRAALETFSPWRPGPGRLECMLEPADFVGNGPHRLALATRVRTRGLTDSWQLDLPMVPFSFEFDPTLRLDALLALEDDARAATLARAVRLETPEHDEQGEARVLALHEGLVIRNPPVVAVATPLPCDLAHALAIEFEGVDGQFPAGSLVLGGQGARADEPPGLLRFAIGPIIGVPPTALDRPGDYRLRVVLTADPDRGWADPDVRSLWPGTLYTNWVTVQVMRR
ncbi:MAG: hypothetical protein IRY99_23465 [Isosphaeraceae bacterium]|nr:hypothetical protein [Isosphaeraceae bacterium]